jgi:DNA processing protein
VTDEYSKGCNQLIRDSKASLLLSAEDLVEAMGWTLDSHPVKVENVQRSLFLELTEEEQKVVHTLEKQGNLQINTLVVETDIPVHKMSAILFELEMKGAVRVLAGGVYQLL